MLYTCAKTLIDIHSYLSNAHERLEITHNCPHKERNQIRV